MENKYYHPTPFPFFTSLTKRGCRAHLSFLPWLLVSICFSVVARPECGMGHICTRPHRTTWQSGDYRTFGCMSRIASAHSPTTLSAWVCACVCVPDVVVPGKIGMRLADSGLAVRQLSSSWPAVSCRLNISSGIVSYHACMCDRVFNFGIRTRPSINLNPFCVLHERREDPLR